jgi:hypothetical protein
LLPNVISRHKEITETTVPAARYAIGLPDVCGCDRTLTQSMVPAT